MAGLFLYRSNRAEHLARALADLLRQPVVAPLVPETVIVQSVGMRKWLSLELATHHGICANCRFPFPKKFVDEAFATIFPGLQEDLYFERGAMTWRLMKLLPDLAATEPFAPIKNYLRGENRDLKLFQISSKVAHLFDQYIVFRPEMVLGWEDGKDAEDWQAILWRELTRDHKWHQAAQGKRLNDWMQHKKLPQNRLPHRLSVFGISSLPKFYIEFLGAISETIEVHCFLLDPCQELWAHIISEVEEDAIRRRSGSTLTSAELHSEDRNSLLASLGKIGRDFQDLVLDLKPVNDEALFEAPEGEGMLPVLQRDILILADPIEKRTLDESDRSIQVHSCHSPMRELEVLQDQLLALFEKDRELLPKDIVVMMPDVGSYAPFIEAVFGSPERPERYIPYSIADRGVRAENALANTLLQLLEVARGRFGASSVLSLLESAAIQQQFEFSESDLETIRSWVEKVAIRWGIDGEHRKRLGLPASDQNTWREGLRRLLLGYALPARNERLFEGILPCDDIEAGYAETLGNFAAFMERLFALAAALNRPHTLAEWEQLLLRQLEAFFVEDENTTAELHLIRQAIGQLSQIAVLTDFDETVSPDVLVSQVTALLEEHDSGFGFMAGQVTFCALRPMRSIPFKVVCLIGMNDGSYPRHFSPPAFDKMAADPRRGDRNTRFDDRYLFLEAILSARQNFYLSYVGQSIRDNSALTPSVLVSELLDYLDRAFQAADGSRLSDALVTKHQLQAFSPAYFAADRLFSYSSENCKASQASLQARHGPAPFITNALPPLEERSLALDTLASFLCAPAQFFLRNRLGVLLKETETALPENENFELDGLTGFSARNFLADRQASGMEAKQAVTLLKATGQLPHGSFGDCHASSLSGEIETFLKTVRQQSTGEKLPDIAFARTIAGWELHGVLRNVFATHALRYRCAAVKTKDILRAWVQHLALNIVTPGKTTILVGLDKVVSFHPVAEPDSHLQHLVAQYSAGMIQPLRFFPQASYTYSLRKLRPSDRQRRTPRQTAEADWLSEFGESTDANIQLCFRGVEDILDQEWEQLAESICGPIIQHSAEEAI